MNILGLDLSLLNTGWVILNDKGMLVNAGVIKSKKKGVERLNDIDLRLWSKTVKECDIQLAVIEGYAFGIRNGRSFSIGELGGVIKATLCNNYIPYYVVSPPSLKKFITGKGRCDKNEIMKEVYKKWNVDLKSEHENDAYGLARIGLEISRCKKSTDLKKLLKYEKEVIKTVLIDISKNNWVQE